MPDKLTDNEIVKALEYEANEKVCIHEVYEPACGMWCKHLHLWCTDFNGNSNKNNCSAFKPTATNKRTKAILDLINHQKVELKNNENIIRFADKTIETANAEIERLKQNLEEAHIDIREHLAENERLKEENNRLQAENERLKNENTLLSQNSLANKYPHCVWIGDNLILSKSEQDYDKLIANIKAEAYKEFAERLKTEMFKINYSGSVYNVVDVDDINNLLKELVEEQAIEECEN